MKTATALQAAVFIAGGLAMAEDWAGTAGGGLRHNASIHDVPPGALAVLWQRSFAPLPIGDQQGPNDEMNFAAGKGSQNLTLVDGKIALIGVERANVPNARTDYYSLVLAAADGRTVNWIRIKSSEGNTRAYRWPHYCVSASGENLCGFVGTAWDAASGIFYCAQGAYPSSYTAWLPLHNAATFAAGAYQEGMPAYGLLSERHPGFQDAFGRTRGEMETVFGPGDHIKPMQPYTWGLSGFYVAPEKAGGEKPPKYDTDLETVFGPQGSSFYNTSAVFALDADGPLMVQCKGADWGHNSSGDAYVFNKHTGLKAVARMPYPGDGRRLRPFASGGAVVGNGRIFCAGPSDGKLGVARPEGSVPKRDQGLYLWAYDVALSDAKANDGYEGEGKDETATLTPAFLYRFESRFTPDPADIQSYGQSYYECDGFYRPKAMLIDPSTPLRASGASLWMAWKPSATDAVELIHATDGGAKTYSLGVGRGLYGVDIWPKMSLSEVGGTKLIAYFTGHARHCTRFMPDDVEAALKTMQGPDASPLTPKEIELTKQQAPQAGIWHGELQPPRGPAELAVFDATRGALKWTYNVSARHPSLPANEFWTYLDKTAMVAAGKWAYVGWVDVTGETAALRFVAFDMTADAPAPVETALPLSFPSKGNEKTVLTDLIAADGRLYALVTRSDRLWVRDPRWASQIVLAIGRAGE